MKKSKKKKNNKGFTLVELLAVIAILSVVLSLTVYISLDVVKSAREKSYEVTINNVEKNANTYVAENSSKIFYLTNGNIEYQCITVNDLIEMGYLKTNVVNSPVSSDKKVNENDYIYIERDKNTKTLLKTIYDNGAGYTTSCSSATSAVGDIVFTLNPDINKWSRSKDITITYKLRNYQDVGARSYQYTYTIDSNSQQNVLENPKVLSLNKPSIINTKIVDNSGKTLVHKTISISKIDIVGPTIETDVNTTPKYISNEVTIPIRIKDSESGVNYKTVSKDDFEVSIDTNTLDTSKYTFSGSAGNYTLKITDSTNRGNLIIKVDKDKVFDNVENGNEEITLNPNIVMNQVFKVTASANGGTISTTTGWTGTGTSATKNVTYGNTYGTLPTVTRTGYTFNGWYTLASGGTKIESTTKVTITANQTLYAQWTANTYKITLNKNGATNTPTASITATYNSSTLSPSSITLPQKKYKVSGFELSDSRYSTGASVSSTVSLTATYGFKGWYSASNGGSLVLSNAASPVLQANVANYTGTNGIWTKENDATLYAQFTSTSVTLPTITKTGHTCGWTTSPTGTTITYQSGTKMTPTSNMTLYGVCVAEEYKVTAIANSSYFITDFPVRARDGEDCISNDDWFGITISGNCLQVSKTYRSGQTYGSFPNIYIANNRVLDGWWTEPYKGGYQVKESDIVNDFITIHPRWRSKYVTVTLDANGGSLASTTGWSGTGASATKSILYNGRYGTLPTPTRTGYTFMGWYETKDGGREIKSSTYLLQSAKHTIYAHWKGGACNLKFYDNTKNPTAPIDEKTVTSGASYGTFPEIISNHPCITNAAWYAEINGIETQVNSSAICSSDNNTDIKITLKYDVNPTCANMTNPCAANPIACGCALHPLGCACINNPIACMQANSEAYFGLVEAGDWDQIHYLHDQVQPALCKMAKNCVGYDPSGDWVDKNGNALYTFDAEALKDPSYGGSYAYIP